MIAPTVVKALIEAALDQPSPTPALVTALNWALTQAWHPLRLHDPRVLIVEQGIAHKRFDMGDTP